MAQSTDIAQRVLMVADILQNRFKDAAAVAAFEAVEPSRLNADLAAFTNRFSRVRKIVLTMDEQDPPQPDPAAAVQKAEFLLAELLAWAKSEVRRDAQNNEGVAAGTAGQDAAVVADDPLVDD